MATLGENINATVTEFAVTDGTTATPGQWYQLDDEVVEFLGFRQTNVTQPRWSEDTGCWRVKRGVNRTTAASHTSGATLAAFSGAGGGGLDEAGHAELDHQPVTGVVAQGIDLASDPGATTPNLTVLAPADQTSGAIFRVDHDAGGTAIAVSAGSPAGNFDNIAITSDNNLEITGPNMVLGDGGNFISADGTWEFFGDVNFYDPGVVRFGLDSAPADGDLQNSTLAIWIDATPGSTKLMVKAKDSDGTVRTGSLNLT